MKNIHILLEEEVVATILNVILIDNGFTLHNPLKLSNLFWSYRDSSVNITKLNRANNK